MCLDFRDLNPLHELNVSAGCQFSYLWVRKLLMSAGWERHDSKTIKIRSSSRLNRMRPKHIEFFSPPESACNEPTSTSQASTLPSDGAPTQNPSIPPRGFLLLACFSDNIGHLVPESVLDQLKSREDNDQDFGSNAASPGKSVVFCLYFTLFAKHQHFVLAPALIRPLPRDSFRRLPAVSLRFVFLCSLFHLASTPIEVQAQREIQHVFVMQTPSQHYDT